MYSYYKYKTKYLELKEQVGGNKNYIQFIVKDKDTIQVDINDIDKITSILTVLNNNSNILCLDYHGVTDLFPNTELLPSSLPKVILSYIGGNPKNN
jgi:hypothetical protein